MSGKVLFSIVIPDKIPRSKVVQDLIQYRKYGKVHNDKTKYSRKTKHKKEWD